jgi:hypothetical protein
MAAATAAQAAPDGAWHLGGIDTSGAWAYAEPPKALTLILIAMRMRDAQPGDNGTPAYSGATFIEELDCPNMKSRAVKQIYYGADSAIVSSVDQPAGWVAVKDSGDIDGVLYSKCTGRAMLDKGQQKTGTDSEAQKWLADLVAVAGKQ